jgi:Na+-driven multidrug efflux pump
MATGIFSALGDSKTPFIFLAVSSVTNIFIDIIFVKAFNMGIAGVAWATFICQGISAVLAVIVVFIRLSKIKVLQRCPVFSFIILVKLLKIAIPSILQQSFISIGNIIIQSVINEFGAGTIAGYSAAVKLNNLVITSFTTLANGISNFTAQNLGAGKSERIRDGFKAGLKMVWIISIPLVLLYFFAGKQLLYLFLDNPTNTAIHTGIMFLCILSPFYFVVSTKLVADGILRGAGLMSRFMITTFTDLILRVVLAIILSKQFGSTGIWCAWPIGWSIATTLSVIFYKKAKFHM